MGLTSRASALVVRDGASSAGKDGRDGAPGAPGWDGLDGKDGKDGVSGWVRVVGDFSATTVVERTVTADCPAGKV